MRRGRATRPPGCKRLLWFTALSELRDARGYWEHLFAAVMSAKTHAPSLQPTRGALDKPNSGITAATSSASNSYE